MAFREKCDLSNGAISTANASQNDVFFSGPLTMFTLMFSASVKLLNSSTLSSFRSAPSLSLSLSVMYAVCLHACVLTAVWTVLQAKVQRLFLRVRI